MANYLTYKDYGLIINNDYSIEPNAILEDDYVSSSLLTKDYTNINTSQIDINIFKKYDDLTDYFNQKQSTPKSLEQNKPSLEKRYEDRYKETQLKSLKNLDKGDRIFINVALTMKDKKWADTTIPVKHGKWEIRETATKNMVAQGNFDYSSRIVFSVPDTHTDGTDFLYEITLIPENAAIKATILDSSVAGENYVITSTELGGVDENRALNIGKQNFDFENLNPERPEKNYRLRHAYGWASFVIANEVLGNINRQLGSVTTLPQLQINYYAKGSSFNRDTNSVKILGDHQKDIDAYDYDVIAHEIGHWYSNALGKLINDVGGYHSGENQYDAVQEIIYSDTTWHNKNNSLRLVLSEGFGYWFALNLSSRSSYGNLAATNNLLLENYDREGKRYYTFKPETNNYIDFEADGSEKERGFFDVYGEDSEMSLIALLWDLSDANSANDIMKRAVCAPLACKDDIALGFKGLFDIFLKKPAGGFSNYSQVYAELLKSKSIDLSNISTHNITETNEQDINSIANLNAEYGIGFYLPDLASTTNLKMDLEPSASPLKISYQQLKTGALPGIDNFDLIFYAQDTSNITDWKPIYNIQNIAVSGNVADNTLKSYTLTAIQKNELKLAIDNLPPIPPAKQSLAPATIKVMFVARASGSTALDG